MWFSAIKLGLNAASHIYKKRQETKMRMADAQYHHAEKMANGEEAYQGKLLEARQSDWKDEFVLLALMIPAICSFLPFMQPHIARGFEILETLPEYYTHLLYLACSVSLGVRAAPGIKGMISKKT